MKIRKSTSKKQGKPVSLVGIRPNPSIVKSAYAGIGFSVLTESLFQALIAMMAMIAWAR